MMEYYTKVSEDEDWAFWLKSKSCVSAMKRVDRVLRIVKPNGIGTIRLAVVLCNEFHTVAIRRPGQEWDE
jgi:hypothetical protein